MIDELNLQSLCDIEVPPDWVATDRFRFGDQCWFDEDAQLRKVTVAIGIAER